MRTISLVWVAEWGRISAFGRTPSTGLTFWPDLGWPFLYLQAETYLPLADRLGDTGGKISDRSRGGAREPGEGTEEFYKLFISTPIVDS